MPYYAVGFGSWAAYGYRQATEKEIAKWREDNPGKEEPKEFLVRNACYDGSSAKVAGPFDTAKQAWEAASELQEGATMMASWPFVFKAGTGLKLSTLAKKIDYEEYITKAEYAGEDSVHEIVLTRDWQHDLAYQDENGEWNSFWVRGKRTPASRLARCRMINAERKRVAAHKQKYGI